MLGYRTLLSASWPFAQTLAQSDGMERPHESRTLAESPAPHQRSRLHSGTVSSLPASLACSRPGSLSTKIGRDTYISTVGLFASAGHLMGISAGRAVGPSGDEVRMPISIPREVSLSEDLLADGRSVNGGQSASQSPASAAGPEPHLTAT